MKNSFMNLALPLWLFSEPMPPLLNKDKDYDTIVLGPIKAIPNGKNQKYYRFFKLGFNNNGWSINFRIINLKF